MVLSAASPYFIARRDSELSSFSPAFTVLTKTGKNLNGNCYSRDALPAAAAHGCAGCRAG
jgi:hypothetical protein